MFHASGPISDDQILPRPVSLPKTPKRRHWHLRNLGSLSGSHLLAILVVAHTRGRSAVAATDARSDTRVILSAVVVLSDWERGARGVFVRGSTKAHLRHIRGPDERVVVLSTRRRTGQSCRG